jgi:aquaporin Z
MAPRLPAHWPEYAIEGGAIGTFMVSAAVFGSLLNHPGSPIAAWLVNPWLRRGLMGLAMGLTAASIIYSPWGQRSGAHMNPAITFTFFRLGKVTGTQLVAYATAQFVGAAAGMSAVALALGPVVAHPSVNWVTTMPGGAGEPAAFAAEVAISFGMMLMVLSVSNHPRFARFTGVCAGVLVWSYITFEAPLSGMSMNPARTLGSALAAGQFPGLWIYFTAPPLGMLAAAEAFVRRVGAHRILCAKLHHPPSGPCIFGCRARTAKPAPSSGIQATRTAVHIGNTGAPA